MPSQVDVTCLLSILIIMTLNTYALCQVGRQVPAKALLLPFGNSVREFYNMFTATGRHLKDLCLGNNREEINNGYSLFVFNMNPLDYEEALSPIDANAIQNPSPANDSVLKINAKRQVLVDYF